MSKMTIIEHGGVQHPIYTGWDEGTVYHIGDRIKWWPIIERPGLGIDGVYSSFYNDEPIEFAVPPMWFVVISDGIVVDVVNSRGRHLDAHRELENKWPKSTPDRSLWPQKVWDDYDIRVANLKKQAGFKRTKFR